MENTTSEPVVQAQVPQNLAKYYQIRNIVYFILGVIEFLLLFRFVFLILGANSNTPFSSLIYGLSRPFLVPFYGIFGVTAEGEFVLDPSIIVAMLVYAFLAWGLMKLVKILLSNKKNVIVD